MIVLCGRSRLSLGDVKVALFELDRSEKIEVMSD